MNFFSWHYSQGISLYIRLHVASLIGIVNYFGLIYLIPTLFSPYKKLIMPENKHNISLGEQLNVWSFNLVSRFIGAIVRLLLLIFGLVSLVILFISGLFGLLIWVLIPFLSLSFYFKYLDNPDRISKDFSKNPPKLFKSRPWKELSMHLGVPVENLKQEKEIKFEKEFTQFQDLVEELIKQEYWPNNFFIEKKITKEDLYFAAKWWNDEQIAKSFINLSSPDFGPSIARELTFAFTPTVDKYAGDLSIEIKDFGHQLIGRKNLVDRIKRTFDARSSVILTGDAGVGKRTVVLAYTKSSTKQRVVELDLNFLVSETSDINQKKFLLSKILAEGSSAGNLVLVVRDLHRFTNMSVEGNDFTDIFEEVLQKGNLKLIAISEKSDYERFLSVNSRIRKYFDVIEVTEPNRAEALEIMIEAAREWKKKISLNIAVPILRKIVDSSDKYITQTPFPEKALEILTALITYHLQNSKDKNITLEEADFIITERTGVPVASLNSDQTKTLANLESLLSEKLIDQPDALSLISKVLRSKSTGVVNSKRPIGSFLFLGPTGVGKTETAKVLARIYFGSEQSILRYDMAEYVGEDSFNRFLNSLSTNIQKKPASLLLLDEIEKSPAKIFNLLLALLDEGLITDESGMRVNCSNLFVVATSNAGAEFIRQLVTTQDSGDIHEKVKDHVMREGHFSPELINRFDGVVVYKPLTREGLAKIAKNMFENLAKTMKEKNIDLNFNEAALEKIVSDGYEPEFGARPMRRLFDIELGDLLGKALLENKIQSGDEVKIIVNAQNNSFDLEKIQ